jgi:hypothetical protein
MEVAQLHDMTELAGLEGYSCNVAVSQELWEGASLGEAPDPRFRAMLARLRDLLLALQREGGAAQLCAAVLRGEPSDGGAPNAVREIAEARRFFAQVGGGARGVSRNGRLLAFDVHRGGGHVTVTGALIASPWPKDGRRPILWLSTLQEREAAVSSGVGAMVAAHSALAGIGG